MHSHISPWLTPVVYPLLRYGVIPGFFGSVSITGQQYLPKTGPVILAPTHRSRWDALLVPYATGRHVSGRDLRFMVSADEMTGLQGWFIRRLGGFPMNPRQPAITSLRFGIDMLKNSEMIVIFPEGAIFRDHRLHRLRPGLARLALQVEDADPLLGVQVVPIDLNYSDPFPSWGTTVNVSIGCPLKVKDYYQSSESAAVVKDGAKRLTADLAQALFELGHYGNPEKRRAIAPAAA